MSEVQCGICPHACRLKKGQIGFCRARSNQNGKIQDDNYGMLTAIALDPIEKKPLNRFYPGGKILSVGSYGCNLRCSFCQNCEISMVDKQQASTVFVSPQDLLEKAVGLVPSGNIGIAFTYNEPLIGYEYVRDCAALAAEHEMKIVLVTNGYINQEPLLKLLPLVDAMNIDLKSFNEAFYQKISGHLEPVKQTILAAAKHCHVEVTTLIIPGENDLPEEMDRLSGWLSDVDPAIPLHISRFFPRHKMTDKKATSIKSVYLLAETARKHLQYVYEGNC